MNSVHDQITAAPFVMDAWRTMFFRINDRPTVDQVSEQASKIAGQDIGHEFTKRICELAGYRLA